MPMHSIAARYRRGIVWLAEPPYTADANAIALLAHMYQLEPDAVLEDIASLQPDAVRCPACGAILTEYQLADE